MAKSRTRGPAPTEDRRVRAEDSRTAAESARMASEEARQEAEQLRMDRERVRSAAELARIGSEQVIEEAASGCAILAGIAVEAVQREYFKQGGMALLESVDVVVKWGVA